MKIEWTSAGGVPVDLTEMVESVSFGPSRPKEDAMRGFKRTYRVGRKLGRTIYRQRGLEPTDNDEFLGIMDTPEMATRIVRLLNLEAALLHEEGTRIGRGGR